MSLSRTLLPTAAAIASVFSTLVVVGAEPAALELERLADRSQFEFNPGAKDFLFRMTYPQHFSMDSRQEQPPAKDPDFASVVKKEPKYKCERPLRDVATLGSDHYGLALDSSDFKSKGYDTLYFDRNRNGDLTDDPVITPKPPPPGMRFGPRSTHHTFPRVDLVVNADGKKIDYAFFFSDYLYFEEEGASEFHAGASLNAAAYRDGEIVHDGKSRRVVLIDFNSNGRFDDAWKIDSNVRMHDGTIHPTPGDMLLIDPDTKNHTYFGYGATDRKERQLVSPLVCIDGRFYDLEISPAGDTLALKLSSLPLGSVTNPNPQFDAVLYGDKGMVKISGGKAKPVPLPAGDWKLSQYTINVPKAEEPATQPGSGEAATKPAKKKPSLLGALASIFGGSDDEREIDLRPRFTLVSATATQDCPSVTVHKGKTSALPFGPPFKPVVKVSYVRPAKESDSERNAQLDLRIVGTAGEICSNAMLDGERPPPPRFEITTAKGKSVHTGKFEYG